MSPWAIVSLVCGILWLGWLGSVAAVVAGHVALGEIRAKGMDGRGLAIAGLVLGYFGIGLLLLMIGIPLVLGVFGALSGTR
jgi:hypothetical protein